MNDSIFSLSSRRTREDFITELDEAEKDWEKNGGATLDQIKAKYIGNFKELLKNG